MLHGDVWCSCASVPFDVAMENDGERIAQLRMANGITLRELAALMRVTPVHLGKIERGLMTVDDDDAAALCKHLPGYGDAS